MVLDIAAKGNQVGALQHHGADRLFGSEKIFDGGQDPGLHGLGVESVTALNDDVLKLPAVFHAADHQSVRIRTGGFKMRTFQQPGVAGDQAYFLRSG